MGLTTLLERYQESVLWLYLPYEDSKKVAVCKLRKISPETDHADFEPQN